MRSQQVEVAPGVIREQRSVVHIKKCRYLENSGCVGLCTNMCKVRAEIAAPGGIQHQQLVCYARRLVGCIKLCTSVSGLGCCAVWQPDTGWSHQSRSLQGHAPVYSNYYTAVFCTIVTCCRLLTHVLQIPTQSFFTNDFGLPLTMNPNFDDLSCDMIFGQAPPPLEEDPVYTRSCFVPQCSLAATVEPCPKTDSERDKQRSRPEVVAAVSSNSSSSNSCSSRGSSRSSNQLAS